MAASLAQHEKNGDYNQITSAEAFSQRLTADLRSVGHDLHVRVMYNSATRPPLVAPDPSLNAEEQQLRFLGAHNFGFEKVEILAGNIGYIKAARLRAARGSRHGRIGRGCNWWRTRGR